MPERPDDPFQTLLEHNERIRGGGVRPEPRRASGLVVFVGIVLVLAGLGAVIWATGALDDEVATPGAHTGAVTGRGAGLPPVLHPATTTAASTPAATTTTTAAAAPARSTTLASVDAGQGATQLSLTIPDQAAGATSLTMRATRGDSWVEVRLASSTGRVLQIGTMTEGSSATVQGSRLWIRFGDVGKLDLVLNGKPVRPSRLGTITAIATPSGLSVQG